jgi:putative flavoprotein involved in K+ transport
LHHDRDRGFVTRAGDREFATPNVIVAAGAYQRPVIPSVSADFDAGVVQLHSAQYVEPSRLPSGEVLVVGSANSGVQIAEELSRSRRVHLARGTPLRRMPRRILGRSLHWWGERLGLIDAPLHTLRGRLMNRGDLLIGTSLRQLERRHGVVLHGRAVGASGRTMRFNDGSTATVDAVVWATGYGDDFSWLHVPVLDDDGRPVHRRGETQVPGLFFVGLHRQWSRGSSLIGWVEQDADFVAGRVAARAGAAAST